jgi:Domain of unknown function (DUF5069)
MPEQLPRSPHDTVGGLIYFPRMLDKIRLFAAGKLPKAYHEFLGIQFDGRCLNFLKMDYETLKKRVAEGGSDEEVLEWCFARGRRPTPEEIEIWSDFMRRRGWRDALRERILFRLKEAGMESRAGEIATMFDFIDLDEGRTPPDFSKWEPPRK